MVQRIAKRLYNQFKFDPEPFDKAGSDPAHIISVFFYFEPTLWIHDQ